jgi:hypothetical protein
VTEENYDHAYELLLHHHGQTHKVVNAFMKASWKLLHPTEDLASLRIFHDKLETYVRGLKSLDQEESNYGQLLVPKILDKLPGPVRQQLTRTRGDTEWNSKDILDSLRKEIDTTQAGDSLECTLTLDSQPQASVAAFYSGETRENSKHDKPQDKPLQEYAKLVNTDDHGTNTSSVLLKTAVADVADRNSVHTRNATILFDEGATRSFIRKELTDQLHQTPTLNQ